MSMRRAAMRCSLLVKFLWRVVALGFVLGVDPPCVWSFVKGDYVLRCASRFSAVSWGFATQAAVSGFRSLTTTDRETSVRDVDCPS